MKKRRIRTIVSLCAAAAAVVILLAVPASRRAAAEEAADSVQAIEEAVQKLALQCYVIEGAYPDSLAYLEENYGLTVNKEDFKVMYTPFAENLPPDVRVLVRS